ncbi:hypothetical protein G5B31_05220 [Rhodobacter sp. SGA-6-6]|uniref:hypothetical protein n=1 Tax=Rhodobacter sp. SGA-6-6 TaxID=2710882 RepID=UPI0013EDD776|nr:hypothetical protein [Rhodobacter sp. SGA-6-6]NGM44932.1 hypothetical protein [Rhodobacter sp. SGA-6-6]
MRGVLGAVMAGFLATALPAAAETAAICQRGAQAGTVPLDYLLHLEGREYHDLVLQRMDPAAFDPGPSAAWEEYLRGAVLAEAIEWPGVLADKAADLPPAAHDLPWLVMLADLETGIFGPAEVLLTRPQSILLPDILPLMERHGLAEEVAVLREGMALFPEWGLNPAERQLAIYSVEGEIVDARREEALRDLDARYPRNGRAMAAAVALLQGQPELAQLYRARLDAMGDEARLDHLVLVLRRDCLPAWLYAAEEVEAAYLSLGSAQAGLLMMDDLAQGLDGALPQIWLDSSGSALALHLLRVLELRNETALVEGLRRVLAEFPRPFPRDGEARWSAMDGFGPETWNRLDTALPEDAYDLIRSAMLSLARDSGLLP